MLYDFLLNQADLIKNQNDSVMNPPIKTGGDKEVKASFGLSKIKM